MDLETENRIASILMKEAAELRRQADKEGVHAYLSQSNSRFRPNSRFLTATVLGVQQANRAVDINEMWNVRQKELELDNRQRKGGVRDESRSENSQKSTSKKHAYAESSASGIGSTGCSSSKRAIRECNSREDEDLKDDDIDEFLRSRVKRGRGAIGTRMDEPGPYPPSSVDPTEYQSTNMERWGRNVILGPEKPRSLKSSTYDDEEVSFRKKAEKDCTSKRHSQKHKEKSNDKKKKRRKDNKISKRHT